ncbi:MULTISPECIES: hypothetical protein [unclassified Curtobacterium]|uniref:hypothetical protein n=1 Tax=unclassified Curtobacterium TaxID=257496 RepID=UPI0015E8CCDD|nr:MULTISPECIES: hypothetical protein [unclassified Curtobacterium]WIB33253.1 hypothetical protein DEJ20_01985 [Curtobacterium sp. MCSS17_005]
MPRTVFFDVNGTLSDTAPLAAILTSIGVSATPVKWLAAALRDGFALRRTTGRASVPGCLPRARWHSC